MEFLDLGASNNLASIGSTVLIVFMEKSHKVYVSLQELPVKVCTENTLRKKP